MNPEKLSPLQEAAKLIRIQEFKGALEILTSYIRQNPESEEGWFLLSFALQDPQHKRECLERVILINPNNARAHERLAKLAGKPDQQAAPQETLVDPMPPMGKNRKRMRWFTYPVSILVLLLIGYISVGKIIPSFSPEPTAFVALQQDGQPTITPTNSPTQTSTATYQPTTTPTKTPTPTPSITTIPPSPTKDFPTPEGELAQQMDDVQNQVSTIRELGILVDSPRYLISQSDVRSLISYMFLERNSKESIKDHAIALRALGLIEPGYDLYNNILSSLDEGLGGFYIPWTDEIFVIGGEFSIVEKFTFAHEYDHALTDQHFHIEDISVYPECIQDNDRCQAITSLIEGDATYLMYQWLQSYASEDEIAELENMQYTPIDHAITSHDFPPPYIVRDIYFKYFDGRNFIDQLYQDGGWLLVNKAYLELPSSTEQILHPEKYLSREDPIQVDLQPLDSFLDDEWRHITTGTLGELMTEMILGYNSNYLVQIDPIKASAAAAGWGGNSYQVYHQSKTNQSILVANWEWDNIDERNEFWEAMTDYLNRRFQGREVNDSEYTCWTKLNDHFSCIFRRKNNSLWIIAPTLDLIFKILDDYPDYK
jgi:hypothetical protein